MAMLDKRLRRMEDRIIRILPKSEQDASASAVTRAVVKPALPGSLNASARQATKKRKADEAFGNELQQWAQVKSKAEKGNKSVALQAQEDEENKLLEEGRDALPSQEVQEHLAEIYFEVIYGQAYHLLHKPSYMRKLKYVMACSAPIVARLLTWVSLIELVPCHPSWCFQSAPYQRGFQITPPLPARLISSGERNGQHQPGRL